MAAVPKIAATVAAPSMDLSNYVGVPYDQGQENSCVAYSIAGLQSMVDSIAQNHWMTFDAEELYMANGGANGQGIDANDALNWDENTGLRDEASGNRYRILNFAAADLDDPAGVMTVKQAVSARLPCVMAMLLPSDFDAQMGGAGDCNGTITGDYHQVCIVGYTPYRVMFLNSWGPNWGRNGVGQRERWAALPAASRSRRSMCTPLQSRIQDCRAQQRHRSRSWTRKPQPVTQ